MLSRFLMSHFRSFLIVEMLALAFDLNLEVKGTTNFRDVYE